MRKLDFPPTQEKDLGRTKIYFNSKNEFKIVSRGSVDTKLLVGFLKGLDKRCPKHLTINKHKAFLFVENDEFTLDTGGLSRKHLLASVNLLVNFLESGCDKLSR